jgi:hypothetical protein
VIVNRMDSKNRVISLDRKQLAAVQDLTACPRWSEDTGRKTGKTRSHVPHREFRLRQMQPDSSWTLIKAVNTEELDKVKPVEISTKLFVADTAAYQRTQKDIQTAESKCQKSGQLPDSTELKEGTSG